MRLLVEGSVRPRLGLARLRKKLGYRRVNLTGGNPESDSGCTADNVGLLKAVLPNRSTTRGTDSETGVHCEDVIFLSYVIIRSLIAELPHDLRY